MKERLKFRVPIKVKLENGNWINLVLENVDIMGTSVGFDKEYIEEIIEKDFEGAIDSDEVLDYLVDIDIFEWSDDFYVIPVEEIYQATGVFDATKFKELSEEEQKLWLENNSAEDWKGREIYEGDIVQIKRSKDHVEYGIVAYRSGYGGGYYTKGYNQLSSYQKITKVVGQIYGSYPKEAEKEVKWYLEQKGSYDN